MCHHQGHIIKNEEWWGRIPLMVFMILLLTRCLILLVERTSLTVGQHWQWLKSSNAPIVDVFWPNCSLPFFASYTLLFVHVALCKKKKTFFFFASDSLHIFLEWGLLPFSLFPFLLTAWHLCVYVDTHCHLERKTFLWFRSVSKWAITKAGHICHVNMIKYSETAIPAVFISSIGWWIPEFFGYVIRLIWECWQCYL